MTAMMSEQAASTTNKSQELDVSTPSYRNRMSIETGCQYFTRRLKPSTPCIPREVLVGSLQWNARRLLARVGYDEKLQIKFLQSYRKVTPSTRPETARRWTGFTLFIPG